MRSLKEVLEEARKAGTAVGHFNVSNLEQWKGVLTACEKTKLPAVIGMSEGERNYFGLSDAVALLKNARQDKGLEVYLNADHTHSLENVEKSARAGFDAVLFDCGKLSLEENIKATKEAVKIAKNINPNILIEGELGYLGSGSALLDAIPSDVDMSADALTSAADAACFTKETGIDLLAPSVGTIHGLLKNIPHPKINFDRIKELSNAVGVPLVLHGGSGTSEDDFVSSVKSGISLVHVSTELRRLWRLALEGLFKESPDEINPGRVGQKVVEALSESIASKMRLFALASKK